MGYQKIDLNLFALFDTLMRQRSVSAAGRELGVTASAISHGLARLRRLLGDELFVARPNGMEPTARAMELAPDIRDGLSRLAVALEDRAFDPAETTRTFTIGATDYGCAVAVAPVVHRLVREAPNIHLKLLPLGRLDVIQQLEEGRLHAVIGWFTTVPGHICRNHLLTEHEAVVVVPGHPLTQGKVTNERLLSFPHAVVEVTGSEAQGAEGFLDDRGVVRRIWIERLLIEADGDLVGRVAVTVPHYADVPVILRDTDMVATLPARLARQAAARGELVMLDLPYEPHAVRLEMIWHERAALDPGLQWFLELFVETVKEAPAD